jgi:hypothetical protein
MPTSYLPYNPQQQMLLPYALQEWLPKGHLAYYISDTVDELDLSAFHARYGGGGPRNQPYHPAMMVKVLLYAYATGVFSSRKIARKLHEDVAFRVPGAGNFHWMPPGAAARMTNARRVTRMASPNAGRATSGNSVYPKRARKRTSPTPTAGS